MTQREVLEVKLLMLLGVLSSSWLNCMEKAPTGVPFCVRDALPGEVGAGLDQVASTCILRARCSGIPVWS